MDMLQMKKLKPGDEVIHKRYGPSKMLEIKCNYTLKGPLFFGMVIEPKTEEGKKLLFEDCGFQNIPYLEGQQSWIKLPEKKVKR